MNTQYTVRVQIEIKEKPENFYYGADNLEDAKILLKQLKLYGDIYKNYTIVQMYDPILEKFVKPVKI